MKKTALLIIFVLLTARIIAQEEVKLQNGRTIILNNDSTWSYKQESVSTERIQIMKPYIITIKSNGCWEVSNSPSFDNEELKIAQGITIILSKDSTWSVKPKPPKTPDEFKLSDISDGYASYINSEAESGSSNEIKSERTTKAETVTAIIDTFVDARDGKSYPTVKIGEQTWFAKNLAYKTAKGCWVYNNIEDNADRYGYYYDWKTANTVCPSGWHLSNDDDWLKLDLYLDGESVAGGKLKSTSSDWKKPNTGATNSTGFSAIPCGAHDEDGTFSYLGEFAYWWSASEFNSNVAWARRIGNSETSVYKFFSWKVNGFSVRCVMDLQTNSAETTQ